jgi:hypothetical protein
LLGGQGVVGAALQAEVVDEEKQVPLAELARVRFLILPVIRQRLMSVRIWARIPPGRAPRIGVHPNRGMPATGMTVTIPFAVTARSSEELHNDY